MREFKVTGADVGMRTDVFVAAQFPEFTRSSLEVLFENQLICVNGQAAKESYRLREGDKISVDDSRLRAKPAHIDLPVLYEDDDVVVIDKPAGVLTHSKGALNTEPTVASFLAGKITDKKLAGNRAGIVHRLDRATSGVIIGAKNARALKWLQKQFSTRKTKKSYVAVVEGTLDEPEAIIDAPIERNPRRPQTFRAGAGGKTAQTHYRVLKTLEKDGKTYSVLELNPVTGRTHQLRVHLAYIGHPIAGDPVYGHGDGTLLLHAAGLELTLPSKKRMKFESQLPVKFKAYYNG